ncbi:glycoside hydrolase family 130 protein [Sphingobacterium sp. WM]|uniref:glycoside hydrolase family 130 protein n=1 Tax=Sphingobacterium sp. WM TaxID=3031802 RepID=UPI00240DF527|nr:glycoside hydrolase family 130 protein [Sphingobacterium sp. WM]WFB65350.1 glycoside hydrolase family 130 protein [Sphingobacterium sp. WM]
MSKKLSSIALLFLFVSCVSTKSDVATTKDIVWTLGGFERPQGVNPIISPDSTTTFLDPMSDSLVRWEENDTFNPGAVVKDGKVYVLYRAEDKYGIGIGFRTSRLGLAESKDGIHFTQHKEPVLFPAKDDQKEFEWPGGIEDPRLAVTEDGTYVVFYTQWNRDVPRLGVATSKDLINWQKHGPIFRNAKYQKVFNEGHKSASIVTKLKNDKLIITKIDGKYFMYWGEHGVSGATSTDLINWEPILNEEGNLAKFIKPREGYFDSALTECGPPAVMTDKGILLLYNGKNHNNKVLADPRFNLGTYSAGQVLFSSKNPTEVIQRMDVPFLRPMEDFEKSGQYKDGTVFLQGLTYFKNKWFLYYGCADSKVGVAVYDPSKLTDFDPVPES